ncbi:hypothetical protein [Pseudomonas phage PPAY]|nr:hypothetical protein [Pseudomonas phage PPAY]
MAVSIPIILVYMAMAMLASGLFAMALQLYDGNGVMSQKDQDVARVLGAFWPVTVPWLIFMAVVYKPFVGFIKAAKRLFGGHYRRH